METQFEISKYSPCREALVWRKQFATAEEAWQACTRGDWMLWIASKVGVDTKKLTLAKALCAKTVIHLMKDERSIKAVKIAEKFGNGLATIKELNDAYAAYASAYAAYAATGAAYAAAGAAAASAYDAYDAYAAAYAAAGAASAATYDASAATYDAYVAAEKQNQMQTANICREILTNEIFKLKESWK